MRRVLHLLKPPIPNQALAAIRQQSGQSDTTLTVVLMHGADPPPLPAGVRIHRLTQEPSTTGAGALTYSDLLDLIFSAGHVIPW